MARCKTFQLHQHYSNGQVQNLPASPTLQQWPGVKHSSFTNTTAMARCKTFQLHQHYSNGQVQNLPASPTLQQWPGAKPSIYTTTHKVSAPASVCIYHKMEESVTNTVTSFFFYVGQVARHLVRSWPFTYTMLCSRKGQALTRNQ